jgi:hypothetical protein
MAPPEGGLERLYRSDEAAEAAGRKLTHILPKAVRLQYNVYKTSPDALESV